MGRSHEFRSCLITSSSATEALGSPSISRDPMGGGHAFRTPKTSVYRWQVQRQYTFVCCFRIFLKRILTIRAFLFLFRFFFFFFFFFFFLASLHIMKSRKKKNIKNTRVLQKVLSFLSLGSDYFSATFYQTYFYYKPSKYFPFTETHFCNLFTQSRKADK